MHIPRSLGLFVCSCGGNDEMTRCISALFPSHSRSLAPVCQLTHDGVRAGQREVTIYVCVKGNWPVSLCEAQRRSETWSRLSADDIVFCSLKPKLRKAFE